MTRSWRVEMARRVVLVVTDATVRPPATWTCAVCDVERLIAHFRPRWRREAPTMRRPAMWLWSHVCGRCKGHCANRSFTPGEQARWEALQVRLERAVLDVLNTPDAPDASGGTSRAPVRVRKTPTGEPSPYDVAVATLTVELGRPEERWTRQEHLECTRRIYRILGWDESTLLRGSQAHQRAVQQRAADAAPAATIDEEEEEG